ncbi:DUF6624 domain-containing protein [Telluria aromaticivorans]|uniref:Uncharacterized protein n=1 Tax=Telluria aromaticivorans TaxID=2725995 RepID=A0A7Y2P180_9BURK|nr:DUF6624 domain-containing protein [Telluria aromaticivorans]NNG24973.1 hypothetical protein [Telluria aromaticivorans]
MHRTCLSTALLAACLGMSSPAHADAACSTYAADLAAMTGADQALRSRIDFLDPESHAQVKLRGHLTLVDRLNTERLKAWIARCGWPSREAHGDRAAGDAWLLAQHADHDVAFQKEALVLIERDADRSGKGVDQLFALMSDRIAVAEKRPQRYGTQLVSRGSDMCDLVFEPMDDREQVEARRAALKMPPRDAYKRLVLEMQHCPTGSSKEYHYAPPAPDSPARDKLTRK